MALVKLIDEIQGTPDSLYRDREISSILGIAVHRIAPSLGETAEEITKSFSDTSTQYAAGSYTGGKMPYTFVISRRKTEGIQQAQPLSNITPHALRWNHNYIGIAVVGDFRREAPHEWQWEGLVELCAVIQINFPHQLKIRGHTELPGASSDPGKECPGKFLGMDVLRREVEALVKNRMESYLMHSGIIL